MVLEFDFEKWARTLLGVYQDLYEVVLAFWHFGMHIGPTTAASVLGISPPRR